MNSLPKNDSFQRFLKTSFILLERECPAAYYSMCEMLAPRQILLTVDGEEMALAFDGDRVAEMPAVYAQPLLYLETSRAVVLDLADGKFTLQQAVLDGVIRLRGGLDDLILFHEGWLLYMRGAVRCPSFPDLLERYRHNSSLA